MLIVPTYTGTVSKQWELFGIVEHSSCSAYRKDLYWLWWYSRSKGQGWSEPMVLMKATRMLYHLSLPDDRNE